MHFLLEEFRLSLKSSLSTQSVYVTLLQILGLESESIYMKLILLTIVCMLDNDVLRAVQQHTTVLLYTQHTYIDNDVLRAVQQHTAILLSFYTHSTHHSQINHIELSVTVYCRRRKRPLIFHKKAIFRDACKKSILCTKRSYKHSLS